MTEEDVIQYAYKKGLEEAQKNDAIDKEKYAEFYVRCLEEAEGSQKCFHHEMKHHGVDLSSLLNKIREKDVEHVLLIALKNGQIESHFLFQGSENTISAESYFIKNKNGESAVDFINKWEKNGAEICNYHNHPMSIAAVPSNYDLNISKPHQRDDSPSWAEAAQKYHDDIPIGFTYSDWGIVTAFDFFSYQQSIKSGVTQKELSDTNNINEIKRLEGFKQLVVKDSLAYVVIVNKIYDKTH